MFTRMKNIDSAFRYVRGFTIVLNAGWMVVCILALTKSLSMVRDMQRRVYILSNGKVMEAYAADRNDNIPVEARDHIRAFHISFFTLDPDDKVIITNINRALYLADVSAKRTYDNLKESGYYNNLVAGNISQRITIDSIALDLERSPFYFRCYATQELIRATSIVYRRLISEGWLRSVSRSDHNPHGFLIERWATIENRDIKTQAR